MSTIPKKSMRNTHFLSPSWTSSSMWPKRVRLEPISRTKVTCFSIFFTQSKNTRWVLSSSKYLWKWKRHSWAETSKNCEMQSYRAKRVSILITMSASGSYTRWQTCCLSRTRKWHTSLRISATIISTWLSVLTGRTFKSRFSMSRNCGSSNPTC